MTDTTLCTKQLNTLVSIIMPIFNVSETLRSSAQTVLNQTYRNLELIIIDDCSTDNSYDLAKEIQGRDARVQVLKLDKNSGAGFARNTGIYKASGDYIAFLDADDKWIETKLEKQLEAFDKTGAVLICSGYSIINSKGVNVGEKQPQEWITYEDLLKSNLIGCLTAIYDTTKIGKEYMPTIRKRQDYAMWLNILRNHGYAYCVQDKLAEYYLNPSSISSNKIEMLKWNFQMFNETQRFNKITSFILTLRNTIYKIIKG